MEGKNDDESLAPLDPAAAQALEYDDRERVLDAAVFMDRNECETVIPAARNAAGRSMREILDVLRDAGAQFALAAREKFGSKGEW